MVIFRAQNLFCDIKIFPGVDTLANIVQVVMSSENQINAMRCCNVSFLLASRR